MKRLGALRESMKERRSKPKTDTEKQLREEEDVKHKAQRDAEFAALTAADVEKAFTSHNALPGAITGLDVPMMRLCLLAGVAASESYSYVSCPHTSLMLYEQHYARLLRVIKSTQLYTLMEGPNKLFFVAIPGTHDMRTTMTDLKTTRTKVSCGKKADGTNWEYKVHSGFNKEAEKLREVLPVSICQEYAAQGYKIVITGHSLGGALASLTTIRHLDEDPVTFGNNITCITFGAPLIGNTKLTSKITENGWAKFFTHFVYRSDIVPRVLTGRGLTKQAIRGAKSKIGGAISRGVGSAKSLFGKLGGSKKDEPNADADDDDAPQDAVETEEQLDNMEVDQAVLERSFVAPPPGTLDEAMSDGEGSSPTSAAAAVPTRAFDCYGTYHFLRRDVEYKTTDDPATAHAILRGGDGLKVVAADHSLLTYHAVLDEMTAKKE